MRNVTQKHVLTLKGICKKRLTLKYMRGLHRPQKCNGMAWKISKAGNNGQATSSFFIDPWIMTNYWDYSCYWGRLHLPVKNIKAATQDNHAYPDSLVFLKMLYLTLNRIGHMERMNFLTLAIWIDWMTTMSWSCDSPMITIQDSFVKEFPRTWYSHPTDSHTHTRYNSVWCFPVMETQNKLNSKIL